MGSETNRATCENCKGAGYIVHPLLTCGVCQPSVGSERPPTVNEGVALMQAWCRYLGVDDNVTVIPSTDFNAGFRAALHQRAGEPPTPELVERAAEAIAKQAEPMYGPGWDALPPAQKGAYRDQARAALAQRAGEPPTPDGMPVFTIKAKDNLAPDTIRHYRMLCRERGLTKQAGEVLKAEAEIAAWRLAHPDLLKDPDHDHVPVSVQRAGEPPTPDEVERLREALAELDAAIEDGLVMISASGTHRPVKLRTDPEGWTRIMAARASARAALDAARPDRKEER